MLKKDGSCIVLIKLYFFLGSLMSRFIVSDKLKTPGV